MTMTAPTAEEVTGILTKIRYAQDGFAILVFDINATHGFVAKGNMLAPKVGLSYTLRGKWHDDPRWGRQFAFDEYQTHLPATPSAVASYLSEHCDFVGPVVADRIIQAFGESSLEVLKSEPSRVAETVKGVTYERAQQIQAHLREIEDSEAIELELKELLTGTRISRRAVSQIKGMWRHEAPARIRANPFALIELIDGVGFSIADEIAKRVGFKHESPERIAAGINHVLTEASRNGHACLPMPILLEKAASEDVLNVGLPLVEHELQLMLDEFELRGDTIRQQTDVYLPSLYSDECYVAHKLHALLKATPRYEGSANLEGLQEDQAAAVIAACGHPVFVITGAPGTGKTYAVKRIIESFPGARVALCAPTGKAARRMSQQTGRDAVTIHRLLGPKSDGRGGYGFEHGENNPVPADLIVVDEVSMLDTSLAARLLEAVAPGARLILVGDTNQLPSVGPGNVLASILASKVVPSATLTKIKRQDPGLIILNAHRIRDGLDVQADNESKDFFILDRNSPEDIRSTIIDLLARRLDRAYGVDRVRDIQVICALREKTSLGCGPFNLELQAKLNSNPAEPWTKFRLGDKVIQLKNEVVIDESTKKECSIANGDIGYVERLDFGQKGIFVQFENPSRLVKIPAKDNALDLAYAVTCHKYQGSEAPIVVIPIHNSAGPLILQRPWIYTAISRAQRVCILVGQRSEIPKIIARNRPERRFTNLVEFLSRTKDPSQPATEESAEGRC